MSWPITLETLSFSPYSFRDSNCSGLFFRDSKFIRLINLDKLTVLAYSFRDSESLDLLI